MQSKMTHNNKDQGSWATWSYRCFHQRCYRYRRIVRQAVGKKAAFADCRRILKLTPFRATWSTYISADDITGSIWFVSSHLTTLCMVSIQSCLRNGARAKQRLLGVQRGTYWSACCVLAGPDLLYLLDWLLFETIHSLLTLSLFIGTFITFTKN